MILSVHTRSKEQTGHALISVVKQTTYRSSIHCNLKVDFAGILEYQILKVIRGVWVIVKLLLDAVLLWYHLLSYWAVKCRSSVITTKSSSNLKQLAVGVCTIHGSLEVLIHIGNSSNLMKPEARKSLEIFENIQWQTTLKPEIVAVCLKFTTGSSSERQSALLTANICWMGLILM